MREDYDLVKGKSRFLILDQNDIGSFNGFGALADIEGELVSALLNRLVAGAD